MMPFFGFGDRDATRGVAVKRAAPQQDRPATILVVDDETDILGSIGLVLRRLLPGTKVLTAVSGKDALAIMAAERLGVLLTDYRMPAMDGFELIAKARAIDATVPVILMTAYADPKLASTATRDYGVGLIVAKPFEMKYLAEVLRAALAGLPVPKPAAV